MFKKILFTLFTLFQVTDSQLMGSQKDNHNCMLDGGYSWCESTSKCQRSWMEPCLTKKTQMCDTSSLQFCRMMCPNVKCPEGQCAMRQGHCCDYKCYANSELSENDICYRFCERDMKNNINKKDKCPTNTKCVAPKNNIISFDSCNDNTAYRCLSGH